MIGNLLKTSIRGQPVSSILMMSRNTFCGVKDPMTGKDCPDYLRLIEGNDLYIHQKTFEDPEYFKKISQYAPPKYLFIGCSDSRVPPNELTTTGPGNLYITRNIANIVSKSDISMNFVFQIAIEELEVKHIMVMGHTQCGGVRAVVEQQQLDGIIYDWLNPVRELHKKNEQALSKIVDAEKRLRKFTELNVQNQVLQLKKNQYVKSAWARGQELTIYGWLCEIETGKIIELEENHKDTC